MYYVIGQKINIYIPKMPDRTVTKSDTVWKLPSAGEVMIVLRRLANKAKHECPLRVSRERLRDSLSSGPPGCQFLSLSPVRPSVWSAEAVPASISAAVLGVGRLGRAG